jgi:hypothetical protein
MVIGEADQEPAYDWMYPIKMFLENHPPSNDNTEVKRIAHKSKQYHLINGILFQRGINGMMMKCISREEGIQLLWDIHGGISDHTHHSALSSARHSGMGSTSPHPRMTRLKLSPSAKTASSSRSRLPSMQILSGLSISAGLSQSGESTSWVFCPGHQEVLDSCSLLLTPSQSGWRQCQ